MSRIASLDFSHAGLSGCEQLARCTSITDESNSRRMVSNLFQDHPAPGSKEPAHTATAMATLMFAVRRRDPELVGPVAPTPRETKRLSEINDQDTLRGHVSFALVELGLPDGYYGNACVPLAALADAGALRGGGSLADAVALVRRAKAAVTAEYVRSTVDVLVLRGRPFLALQNLFVVSDNRHAGFHRVDFGWGEPVYGGPADTVFGVTFFVPVKDRDGEDTIGPAMERFAAEMERLCKA